MSVEWHDISTMTTSMERFWQLRTVEVSVTYQLVAERSGAALFALARKKIASALWLCFDNLERCKMTIMLNKS